MRTSPLPVLTTGAETARRDEVRHDADARTRRPSGVEGDLDLGRHLVAEADGRG